MTPSRAFLTSGVSVLIFMPGPAGMAQDATGLGLFSTCMHHHTPHEQPLSICAVILLLQVVDHTRQDPRAVKESRRQPLC